MERWVFRARAVVQFYLPIAGACIVYARAPVKGDFVQHFAHAAHETGLVSSDPEPFEMFARAMVVFAKLLLDDAHLVVQQRVKDFEHR